DTHISEKIIDCNDIG
nr:RecName: Full=Cystatin-2; AltName: Full=Cystatin-II [Capra hircus]P84911.1 RecName: Full=Cystatin-1; AltName: Full=Cystatin-I [Capra hircus]